MKSIALPFVLCLVATLSACVHDEPSTRIDPTPSAVSRVLLLSVDGLHAQDLSHCLAAHTCPAMAALAQTGVNYSNASTPGLSDSFPGLAALVTGGTPKTTGLFYDVSYDRTLYAPGDASCSGPQGWNVILDETTGFDSFNGGTRTHLDGGGTFNPQAIPHARVDGKCTAVFPHDYIRTNTVFEVIKQNLGTARTAWADKHAWAYDWLNGPSGKGVDDLARTEINSIDTATGTEYDDNAQHTQAFDNLHVQIILDQIDGKDSTGAFMTGVPTLFGTNFQSLSVAQKATVASGGGYTDADFTPGVQVSAAIAYADAAIGRIVAELKARNLLATTLVIVTAKHGQSPADHGQLVKHGDTLTALLQARGYLDAKGKWGQHANTSGNLNDGSGRSGTGTVQTDDLGLIWLKDQRQLGAALATLNANLGCGATGICANGPGASILAGAALVAKFGDPAAGRTPDIILQPNPGVIYTHSKKKDAEHGGNAPDDSHVALLVSLPSISPQTDATAVVLTQVAPTILSSLKLDPLLLNSVKREGTAVLPGLRF